MSRTVLATGALPLLRREGAGRPGCATDAEIAEALEQVVDPCSLAQGTPLSLPAMGLVRGWQLDEDGELVLDVAVTAPGCTYVGGFADAAARAVADLPGVARVVVRLDAGLLWSERLLRADAAAVLGAARSHAREELGRTRALDQQEHP